MTHLDGSTSTADWSERAQRLRKITAKAEVSADFPLVKAVQMSRPAFARLEGAVTTYLWHSLSRAYPDCVFPLDRTLIEKHASDILAMPNRTPNGVLLPRSETFLSFN